jgi:predicted heme/steroid binding protein
VRKLTATELSRCDGRGGAPAYIAHAGIVYDVSGSFLWRNGRHQARHQAGSDLTEALAGAPHGDDLLCRAEPIGLLVEETPLS